MLELETKYETLSKSEARKLHNFMRSRHGNVGKAAEKSNVSINTLKRAVGLLEITVENAGRIRKFLRDRADINQN